MTERQVALITGVTGQDGAYISELMLAALSAGNAGTARNALFDGTHKT
jgi:GDP-D-mannose dehydratase